MPENDCAAKNLVGYQAKIDERTDHSQGDITTGSVHHTEATTPIMKGTIIWKARSPVLSGCLATMKDMIAAKAHGGAQRSNVIVGEYPIVAVRVGRYALKLNPMS